MLSPDDILGEINDPQGVLQIGNLGDTECVCLSYRGHDSGRAFHVVYTGRELSSLVAAVRKGVELAPTAKPRSTVRLSALPAKPIRAQLVLVAPENNAPLLILRFQGSGWKQDVFGQPEVLLDLLQRAQRRAPMPGVVGILDRFGSGVWMVEGQSLEVNDELSHGTGYYGEYVHHSEVPESQVVRAWPVTLQGKMVVAAFEYGQTWEPTQSPDLPQGQQGDEALGYGLVRQSREVHALLSKTMFDSGRVDPVWAGKVALTSILGDLLMSDDKAGYATWSGNGANPVLKQGVQTLKEGKLSPHDLALFAMVSAYFESLQPNAGEGIQKINDHMSAAFNYARFNEPQMRHLILNNWALLLLDRGLSKESSGFVAWQAARNLYKDPLNPTVFCLPPTYPWVKTWTPARTTEEVATKTVDSPPLPSGPLKPPPPIADRPRLDETPPIPGLAGRSSGELEPDDGITLDNEGPFEGLRDLRDKKKRSPLPLVVVGLLLVGAPTAYFALNRTPADTPEATPTAAVTASPTAVPVVMTPTPTPAPPTEAPLPAGALAINGFSVDGKLKESDLLAKGYQVVETYSDSESGIARYQGPDGAKLIANLKLPTRQVTALQGNTLMIGDQVVADLTTLPGSFKDDSRFSKYKIQAVVDDQGRVRSYTFAADTIYLPEALLDAPDGAMTLSRKVKDKNFFESLPKEVANMYMTDGNPLLFGFLGSFENERLKYLLDQGADPNQKSWVDGHTALHACDNVKTAQLLLDLGANPTLANNAGQLPYQTVENPEVRALLQTEDALKSTPTAAPAAASSPSPSPSATVTP